MPYAARRPCGATGCDQLAETGSRCARHQPRETDRPNMDVRRWYRTKRWQLVRRQVLTEEMWCGDCLNAGQYEPSAEVHHKRKHHGDPTLFWDRANLTGLCKRCHSTRTARGE